MEVELHSIDELIEFIKTDQLTPDQLKTLLHKGYSILMFGDESIDEIVSCLERYKDSEMLPLFITDLRI